MSLWRDLARNTRLRELLGGAPRVVVGEAIHPEYDPEDDEDAIVIFVEAEEAVEAEDTTEENYAVAAAASAVAATALLGAAVYCAVRR